MDKIPEIPSDGGMHELTGKMSSAISLEKTKRKKITRGFINYGGLIVGTFLLFVTAVALTTDISITSFADVLSLGLRFFVLLFCSYLMFISCSDSGMKAGYNSDIYLEACDKYNTHKSDVIARHLQLRLGEFCKYYITEELKNTRTRILSDVGIKYEDYLNKYIGKEKEIIKKFNWLSEAQKKAVNDCNAIRPIKLTPEMILKRGRGSGQRSPLGIQPERKRNAKYIKKFFSTLAVMGAMSIMAIDMTVDPSWSMFVSIVLRLVQSVVNGYMGYRFGFENIAFDTAEFMNDQCDLMDSLQQYCIEHPVPEENSANNIKENQIEKSAV